jgi:adenine deaminase
VLPGAVPAAPVPALLRDTIHLGPVRAGSDLVLAHPPGTRIRAIGVESRSLTTRRQLLTLGAAGTDVAHAAVVERHHATGRIGRGYVTGFGLRRGAIASSVAHDAHNCVLVGASSDDMAVALARIAELGGGQVAVLDGRVLAQVPLPLGGLMSDRPAAEVAQQIHRLSEVAETALGVTVAEPFMQLSFIALSVIPQLRLTDGGLVDVDAFAYVPVEA